IVELAVTKIPALEVVGVTAIPESPQLVWKSCSQAAPAEAPEASVPQITLPRMSVSKASEQLRIPRMPRLVVVALPAQRLPEIRLMVGVVALPDTVRLVVEANPAEVT